MRSCLIIWLLLCLLSCKPVEQEQPVQVLESSNEDSLQVEEPSLENYIPEHLVEISAPLSKHDLPAFPKQWGSVKAIPSQWTMLERDEKGYLVYDPCDGNTPGITLAKDKMSIQLQIEEAVVLSIDKITLLKDKNGFTAQVTNEWMSGQVQAEIIDVQRNLVLWQINLPFTQSPGQLQWRMIMSPAPYSNTFRIVKNDCQGMKDFEKSFLPLEF